MTISHGQVWISNLTNFPMLFPVTDPNLKSASNGGGVAQTNGNDILFTAGDGLTKLNHEIESYNPTTGQLVAWVQIPSLSPSADSSVHLLWECLGVQPSKMQRRYGTPTTKPSITSRTEPLFQPIIQPRTPPVSRRVVLRRQ